MSGMARRTKKAKGKRQKSKGKGKIQQRGPIRGKMSSFLPFDFCLLPFLFF
jgi:hypothetical protein